MSHIENRLFAYFVAVAEEQHFARAAERLGITPPTLTNQIQKLERDLGVKLLQRKGNKQTVVTDAGLRFLVRARETLRNAEEAAAVARQAGRGELGRLELGFVAPVLSMDLLRGWIDPFHRAHPEIDITFNRLGSQAQMTGILRKELDVGFTRMPHKYPRGIRGFEIYRQGLALALPSEHPLARHEAISPAMLAREAFISISHELDPGVSGRTETIARLGNFIPRVVKRQDDFMTVLAYVAHGYGIAVVPELMKATSVANVVFRNIAAEPAPQTSIAFIFGVDPSPSANLLIRHMRRHTLRNHGKGAAPPHNHDRVVIPSGLNLGSHPEVRAKRASKDDAEALGPRPSRLGAELVIGPAKGRNRWRRASRGEETSKRQGRLA